jgi:hypothetical protein
VCHLGFKLKKYVIRVLKLYLGPVFIQTDLDSHVISISHLSPPSWPWSARRPPFGCGGSPRSLHECLTLAHSLGSWLPINTSRMGKAIVVPRTGSVCARARADAHEQRPRRGICSSPARPIIQPRSTSTPERRPSPPYSSPVYRRATSAFLGVLRTGSQSNSHRSLHPAPTVAGTTRNVAKKRPNPMLLSFISYRKNQHSVSCSSSVSRVQSIGSQPAPAVVPSQYRTQFDARRVPDASAHGGGYSRAPTRPWWWLARTPTWPLRVLARVPAWRRRRLARAPTRPWWWSARTCTTGWEVEDEFFSKQPSESL